MFWLKNDYDLAITVSSSTPIIIEKEQPAVLDLNDIDRSALYPTAKLVSTFNRQAQSSLVERFNLSQHNYDAFNPSLFTYKDVIYATFRVSNGSYCPHKKQLPMPKRGHLGICTLHALLSGDDDDDYSLSDCHLVDIDPQTDIEWPVPYTQHPRYSGIDDARGFVLAGRVFVMPMVTAMLPPPRVDYTNAKRSHHIAVTLFEMNDDVSAVHHSGIPLSYGVCDAEPSPIQKNWSPLIIENELFIVTRVDPLTIVSMGEAGCKTVFKKKFQRLKKLRGNTQYIPVGKDSYLTVLHSVKTQPNKRKLYYHHFMILRRLKGTFEVDWVSRAFTLPRDPAFRPNGYAAGFQFVVGLERSGDDALISYGDGDCQSQLAILPGFFNFVVT